MGDVSQFGPEYQAVRVSVPSSHGWRAHEITSTVFVRTGEDGALQALSGKCTHLGCTVRWMADEGEFHCPCHGGKFGADGTQIAGPPPDPLVSLTTEVNGAEACVELG